VEQNPILGAQLFAAPNRITSMRLEFSCTKHSWRSALTSVIAVLFGIGFGWEVRSRGDVVVTEFPRQEKPAAADDATGKAAQGTGKPDSATVAPTAADYLRGLRESTRMALLSDKELPVPTVTDQIKLDLVPLKERQERAQLGYKRLRVPKGSYGVEGHGSPRCMYFKNGDVLTAPELARWIRNDTRYVRNMTVYLLACDTGKGKYSFAQELADVLQTEVYAPTDRLWIHRNGTFSVDPGSGPVVNTKSGPGSGKEPAGAMRAFYPSQISSK
jgi:hypothetical protein